jgi:hypothetical protein
VESSAKLVKMPGPKIDPDLKEFIDEILVPTLVRDALKKLSTENHIASKPIDVAQSSERENA